MRRRRGSVFLYVVVILMLVTTVMVAASNLTTATRSREMRWETDAEANASFEGVRAQMKADATKSALTLPIVAPYTCGGITWNVSAQDNSVNIPRSVKLTATSTLGATSYSLSDIVVQRYTPNVMYYAVSCNSSWTSLQSITTGGSGSDGDVYVHGVLTLPTLGGSTINGDLETTGALNVGLVTVTGQTETSATPLPFPSVSPSAYSGAASTTYSDDVSFNNGISFGSPVGSHNALIYVDGDVTLKGPISGQGTLFVNGSLSIVKDVTYANSSSRLVAIVTGNMSFGSPAKNFAGYYFVEGQFSTPNGATRSLARGNIAAGSISISSPLSVTYDPDLFSVPSDGPAYYVPGMWP